MVDLEQQKNYDQASVLKNSLGRKVLRLCRAFPGRRIVVEPGDERRVEIEFATSAYMLVDCVRTGCKDSTPHSELNVFKCHSHIICSMSKK